MRLELSQVNPYRLIYDEGDRLEEVRDEGDYFLRTRIRSGVPENP